MTLKTKIMQVLHPLSITTRFALGIGLLLCLIVTVSLTGYLSIFFVRRADNAIDLSMEIQRMVLTMDRGMERARRLHADFHLLYPAIGLTAAHEQYAQPSVRQIAKVITISHDLKMLISRSAVSEALLERHVDLNLYLSSAKRFADTSIQSVELATMLAAPDRGLIARLHHHMDTLERHLISHQVAELCAQIRAHVQEYHVSSKRHMMQSAFNTVFQIDNVIHRLPGIQEAQREAIDQLLIRFKSTAEEILAVDAAIKAKFNDFAIQAKAVEPISATLVELGHDEVKTAQTRISRANQAATIIMVVITVAGMVLAVNIARRLNNSITQRVVRLTATASEFRTGNLNAIAEEQGDDELSELGHSFNVMATRIRELVDHLEHEVAQRTDELVESEARYRDLFEHSSSGVAVYRPVEGGKDFIFQDFNKAAETMDQVKREEIIGKPVTEVFPAVEEFGLLDVFRQVAKTGLSARHPVSLYSDGRLKGWRENSVYQLPSGEIVAVYNDQTAQKQAEIDKKNMEHQLHQARKMEAIGVLAGGIAHDFNNILAIILGNAELAINDMAPDHPGALNLKEICLASLRAKEVIRQLLSFSRKTEIRKRPISIIPVIEESLSLMRASIPANIEIERKISEDCGSMIADPTQIHQVLINLCTNAAHAMESNGGTLFVGAKRVRINGSETVLCEEIEPGSYLQIEVIDTGKGMPPEIQRRVFDPYYTTKEVGKGSGIGLSVVHGIVKNHNGVIRIESEPGRGSRFEILLPAIEGEFQLASEKPKAAMGGTERILLIDDEPSLLTSMSRFLIRHGYGVQTCSDPETALDLFKTAPMDFDMVITDMTMPKITGAELAEKLLRTRPDLPIILCSGYSEAIDEEKIKELGIRRYVEKPLKLEELAIHIREVLATDCSFIG